MLMSLAILVASCGPSVSTVLLGDSLDNLLAQVQGIIQKAAAGANLTLLSASNVVEASIYNAISAYGDQLNKQLNTTTNNLVDQLQGLVDDLNRGAASDITLAVDGAQQVVNTLPFTHLEPQVRLYRPQLAVVTPGSGDLQMYVQGNFFYASEKKFSPVVKLGNVTLPAGNVNEITGPEVGFKVPSSLLPTSGAGLQPVSIEVDMPYPSGAIFKSIHAGTFKFLVTVVPASPFTSVNLTNTIRGIATKTSDYPAGAAQSGKVIELESYSNCKPQAFDTIVNADQGWTIVPTQIAINFTVQRNPNNAHANIVNPGLAGFGVHADTEPGSPCIPGVLSNGSGSLGFYVTYSQQQPTASQGNPIPLQLNWGDVITVPVTSPWVIDAHTFDGKHLVFKSTDTTSSPYVRVIDQVDNVKISVANLDAIGHL